MKVSSALGRWVCIATLVLLASAPAVAQPVGTTRVAIVDTDVVFSAQGIARYRAALARLDAEQPTFVAAESPTGTSPPALDLPDLGLSPQGRAKLEQQLAELRRTSAQRDAWDAHAESVLEPIRAAALQELAAFAKRRGIGLVLDAAEVGGGLVVAPGVDITAAFIKDHDARFAKRPVAKPPGAPRTPGR